VGLVAIYRWRWSRPAVYAVFGVLGLIDLAFLASNALKVTQGGWLPLAVAAAVFVVMDTWRVGRRVHLEKVREGSLALDLFLARADKMTQRVAGTAVFMSARSDVVPNAMLDSVGGGHALCATFPPHRHREAGQGLLHRPLRLWLFRKS
jgi:KUP system potassium uptake protein